MPTPTPGLYKPPPGASCTGGGGEEKGKKRKPEGKACTTRYSFTYTMKGKEREKVSLSCHKLPFLFFFGGGG